MNPYERQLLVPHQTSSLLREANEARLARDARQVGRKPSSHLVVTASPVGRLRSAWTAALASRPHRSVRGPASAPDVMGHVAKLSVHHGRAG
ncbi:MAG TPA: hypothetical protein VIB99_06490 [Candidatus Limnocylindrales bacterium]